jgi:phosphoribosylformylglycinamidine (FGAM) synthase PurS component
MSGAVNLTIDGESIERVDVIKYLGVEIDEKLNFKQHIDKTVKKMAKRLALLEGFNKN